MILESQSSIDEYDRNFGAVFIDKIFVIIELNFTQFKWNFLSDF